MEEEDELRMLIQEHVHETDSEIGRQILRNWQEERHFFLKVMPEDYKNALARTASEKESAAHQDGAQDVECYA